MSMSMEPPFEFLYLISQQVLRRDFCVDDNIEAPVILYGFLHTAPDCLVCLFVPPYRQCLSMIEQR